MVGVTGVKVAVQLGRGVGVVGVMESGHGVSGGEERRGLIEKGVQGGWERSDGCSGYGHSSVGLVGNSGEHVGRRKWREQDPRNRRGVVGTG